MDPLWKRNSGRDRDVERIIGELRGIIAKSDYKREYELGNVLREVKIKEINISLLHKPV